MTLSHKTMGKNSAIEWTDATWNPWHGCHKVSQGCKNCYMFRDKKRYGQDPNVVTRSGDKTFYAPLKWSEPRNIFTCSWSDFFIEEADAWRDEAFAIMALTPQHTYQVLTKRPDRMLEYFRDHFIDPQRLNFRFINAYQRTLTKAFGWPEKLVPNDVMSRMPKAFPNWPFPNVWLGVSVEDRDTYIHRVPYLAMTPGAVKFLSIEPLLGDLGDLMLDGIFAGVYHWVIVGGESGPDARPMHPDWVRSIRDQCQAAGVPFFFKQWGEWAQGETDPAVVLWDSGRVHEIDPEEWGDFSIKGNGVILSKVGKKKAGRELDGRTWDEMPVIRA